MKNRSTRKKIGIVLGTVGMIAAAVLALSNLGSRDKAVDEFAGDGYGEATTAAAEVYEDVPEDKRQLAFLSSIFNISEEDAKELTAELSEKVPEKILSYEVEEYNDGGFAVRCITKNIGAKEYYLVDLSDDLTPGEMTGPYSEDASLTFPNSGETKDEGAAKSNPMNVYPVQMQPLEKESE